MPKSSRTPLRFYLLSRESRVACKDHWGAIPEGREEILKMANARISQLPVVSLLLCVWIIPGLIFMAFHLLSDLLRKVESPVNRLNRKIMLPSERRIYDANQSFWSKFSKQDVRIRVLALRSSRA